MQTQFRAYNYTMVSTYYLVISPNPQLHPPRYSPFDSYFRPHGRILTQIFLRIQLQFISFQSLLRHLIILPAPIQNDKHQDKTQPTKVVQITQGCTRSLVRRQECHTKSIQQGHQETETTFQHKGHTTHGNIHRDHNETEQCAKTPNDNTQYTSIAVVRPAIPITDAAKEVGGRSQYNHGRCQKRRPVFEPTGSQFVRNID